MVAVYNPSLATRRTVAIPIPDGQYNVNVYQPSPGSVQIDDFPAANGANVICEASRCTLFVNYTVPGQQIGFVFLTRNLTQRGLIIQPIMKDASRIDSDHAYLQYQGFNV